jgi:arsenate reductase (glutaredoxin)
MSEPFPVTIWHNPDCGTSRNTLAMIAAAGYAPTIVDYRLVGWTRELLETLCAEMGVRPQALLREKGTPAVELGLTDPSLDDAAMIASMVAHPILVNRPIVQTSRGTALCRPSEKVLALLDRQPASFVKEDGEVVAIPPQ